MILFLFVAVLLVLIMSVFLIGYPVFIFLIKELRPRPWKNEVIFPAISVIIPSHGSKRLKDKILNTLDQYPPNKMQIVVVYSGTEQDVLKELQSFEEQHLISLITEKERSGKTNALNLGLRYSSHEICVITDSDSMLGKGALEKLISPFSDQSVGAVSGDLRYVGKGSSNKLHNILFNKYKKTMKNWESIVDTCSYAPGELFAFRKKLVDSLPGDVIVDDYYMLLAIRQKGYRCVSAPEARVYEQPPSRSNGTLERTRRVVSGTIFEASRFSGMLFNRKYGVFGLVIFPIYVSQLILLPLFFLVFTVFFLLGLVEIIISLPLLWIGMLLTGIFCLVIIGRKLLGYILAVFFGMLHGVVEYLQG